MRWPGEGKMGASNLWSVLDTANPAAVLKCECKDKDALAINVREGKTAAPFPRCPWRSIYPASRFRPQAEQGPMGRKSAVQPGRMVLGNRLRTWI